MLSRIELGSSVPASACRHAMCACGPAPFLAAASRHRHQVGPIHLPLCKDCVISLADVYCMRCRPAAVLATAAEQNQRQRQRQAAGVLAHAQQSVGSPCVVLKCFLCMIPTFVGCITQVQASFFGVGAPEAVLVGLVALVIFGPQGLAEVIIHTMQLHRVCCASC